MMDNKDASIEGREVCAREQAGPEQFSLAQYFSPNYSFYRTDYEQHPDRLGKGGYGRVYRVTYLLDRQVYAMKKIHIKPHEQDKIMREVSALAKLVHKNVVRYFTSWPEQIGSDSECSSPECSQESYISSSGSLESHSPAVDKPANWNLGGMRNHVPQRDSSEAKKSEAGATAVSSEEKPVVTLYIKMELCDKTLRQHLDFRNKNFPKDIHVKDEDFKVCLNIFRQILKGLKYIHSMEIIHRDIKPDNIFLVGDDLRVKIGDFGLAKFMYQQHPDDDTVDVHKDQHTAGVGTLTYMAPEQKYEEYDMKVDIYSTAVMLYESLHITNSDGERFQHITHLREHSRCSLDFTNIWQDLAEVISQMACANPNNRPSAKEILCNSIFATKDQQIKMLQELVIKQQKENEQLKRELSVNETEGKVARIKLETIGAEATFRQNDG